MTDLSTSFSCQFGKLAAMDEALRRVNAALCRNAVATMQAMKADQTIPNE
jgi:hypothetical protein